MMLRNQPNWSWYHVSDLRTRQPEVIGQIKSIFRDGFDTERDWLEEKIRLRLSRATVIGLLQTQNGPPAGYAIYSSPDEKFDDRFVLWEDGVCVRRALQGQGLTTRLLWNICHFMGRDFGWFGGDTQNPLVYKRYARLGRLFPIDAPFTTTQGKRLLRFLLANVLQVRDRIKELDVMSGRLKGIYREGRLGRYPIGVAGAESFEEYLELHSIDRERGDALLLVAEIQRPS